MSSGPRKRVECFCFGGLCVDPMAPLAWEDVWLRWKGKPGRRVYRASPCLLSMPECVGELKMHCEIRAAQNEPTWYRDDDAEIRQALARAVRDGYAEMGGPGAGLTIITPRARVDRAEAERMLAWWLNTYYGIRNPKFVWRRPDICVTPVGVSDLIPDELGTFDPMSSDW